MSYIQYVIVPLVNSNLINCAGVDIEIVKHVNVAMYWVIDLKKSWYVLCRFVEDCDTSLYINGYSLLNDLKLSFVINHWEIVRFSLWIKQIYC